MLIVCCRREAGVLWILREPARPLELPWDPRLCRNAQLRGSHASRWGVQPEELPGCRAARRVHAAESGRSGKAPQMWWDSGTEHPTGFSAFQTAWSLSLGFFSVPEQEEHHEIGGNSSASLPVVSPQKCLICYTACENLHYSAYLNSTIKQYLLTTPKSMWYVHYIYWNRYLCLGILDINLSAKHSYVSELDFYNSLLNGTLKISDH